MDFSKLEDLNKYSQIIYALGRASTFGGEVWQIDTLQKRIVFQFDHIDFSRERDRFFLKAISLYQLRQEAPIFVRFRYRNIIFRLDTSEFKIIGDKLVGLIPQNIKALATRDSDRYVLPFDLDISLSIQRVARSIKDKPRGMECRIIDVSELGLGILISGPNKGFLKPFDHFCIKAIDHKQLYRDLYGTVLYVAPKSYFPKRHDVRVGLSLSTPLNRNVYCDLRQKCRIVLSA